MFRRVFILSLFLLCILKVPTMATEVDEIINSGSNLMLYLYTPECGYCRQFAPRYSKITKVYENKFKFLKLDANSQAGNAFMYKYNASYVPFVLLINKNKIERVSSNCLMDSQCIDRKLVKF